MKREVNTKISSLIRLRAFDVTLHEPKLYLAEYSTCRHVFSSMLLYQSFRCIASTSDTFESQEHRTSWNKYKYILNDFFIFLDKRGVGGGEGGLSVEHFCCVKMKVNDPPYGSVIFLGSACYWQLIGSYVSRMLCSRRQIPLCSPLFPPENYVIPPKFSTHPLHPLTINKD